MQLNLLRFSYADTETEGVLVFGDGRELATVEQPWRPNPNGAPGGEPFMSCVPDGEYELGPWTRPGGDQCYILTNPDLGVYRYPGDMPGVDRGRYLCLIHAGNWASDVSGCVAPGLLRHATERRTVQSRKAMTYLNMRLGRRRKHTLLIKPATGAIDE